MSSQIFTANGTFIVPTYTSMIVIVDGPGAGGTDSTGAGGANAVGNAVFNTTLISQPGLRGLPFGTPGPAAGGDINASGGSMTGGTNGTTSPPVTGDGGTGDGFTGGG